MGLLQSLPGDADLWELLGLIEKAQLRSDCLWRRAKHANVWVPGPAGGLLRILQFKLQIGYKWALQ